MKHPRIYGVAACAAALLVAGCNGGSSGSGFTSTPSLRATTSKHRPVRALGSSDVTEYPIPTNNSLPIGITVGPDGALWFSEHQAGKVGRITTSGTITEPGKLIGPAHFPFFIAAGSDGNLWATGDSAPSYKAIENGNDPLGSVMQIKPEGAVTVFRLPTQFSDPRGTVEGPDGNAWFAETRGAIGRITPTGVLTEFSISDCRTCFSAQIAAGPGGSLWFTESFGSAIGRITTSGQITTFPFPNASGAAGLVTGPDGNLWVTEFLTNKVARVTTSGTITEYSTGAGPRAITVGGDGNMYFTEFTAGKIGQITTNGVVTEFAIPTSASAPWGIASGTDGNIWFTESATNKIGKLSL